MKKFNGVQIVNILFVSILLTYCTGGTEKTSKVDDTNLESPTGQELELPQRRIVYQIPEMEDVVCHKGEIYYSVDSMDLEADIYTPPGLSRGSKLPVVILTNNYPDVVWNKNSGVCHKDWQMIISWAELIAASGMVAVTYQTKYSPSESESLISYLSKNADKFYIDINRIALFGCSANALAAQSLMQNDEYNIKCAIFYYGLLLTPDQKYYAEIDTISSYGFYFSDLRKVSKIPENIPLLVTRAGMDQYPIIKKTTDHFVAEAIRSNAQLTFINYSDGQHDFDILDDTENSRLIIRQTVDFLTSHLDVKYNKAANTK
jgi:dienelactone hydrolase